MPAYAFETYDVFTDETFAGNPLAVIMDARGLDGDAMLRITREFNLSETTFVLPAQSAENEARVRIFTPGFEMPFAGHPTVGTAIALAEARGLDGDIVLELNAGLFPVSIEQRDGSYFAEFLNPNLPAEAGDAPSAVELDAALSLPPGEIENGGSKPRLIGSGGVDYVYARAPLSAVRSACVNSAAFEALGLDSAVGVYLYAVGGEAKDAAYHARMFAPNAGILEDPATGSAAASLPAHVAASEAVDDGEHRWIVEQGFEMGRPSRIHARADIKNGNVTAVRIGGHAVRVQRGEVFV